VTGAASVGGDARVRLFCALVLPEDVVERLVGWQRTLGDGEFRVVPPGNLHVTLAFLGPRPGRELDAIGVRVENAARDAGPIRLAVRHYRETRSVGMLVLDDEGGAASALAGDLATRLERLGVYRPERRRWLPHLTVVRFRKAPGLAPDELELEFMPSDAAVYLSRLRPSGAEYVVVQKFGLGEGG
jgi:RNA 2',3'-cyclic 3'-phosphodiesterase